MFASLLQRRRDQKRRHKIIDCLDKEHYRLYSEEALWKQWEQKFYRGLSQQTLHDDLLSLERAGYLGQGPVVGYPGVFWLHYNNMHLFTLAKHDPTVLRIVHNNQLVPVKAPVKAPVNTSPPQNAAPISTSPISTAATTPPPATRPLAEVLAPRTKDTK